MLKFWIHRERQIVSFHPVPGFSEEHFTTIESRMARLWMLIVEGYRFQ